MALLLLPANGRFDTFHGYITVAGREFQIRIRWNRAPPPPPATAAAAAAAAGETTAVGAARATVKRKRLAFGATDGSGGGDASKRVKPEIESKSGAAAASKAESTADHKSDASQPPALHAVTPALWCDAALHAVLFGSRHLVAARWQHATSSGADLNDFVIELSDIIDRVIRTAAVSTAASTAAAANPTEPATLPPSEYFHTALREIEQSEALITANGGTFQLLETDRLMQVLTFGYTTPPAPAPAPVVIAATGSVGVDAADSSPSLEREHRLTLTLKSDYPHSRVSVSRTELPIPVDWAAVPFGGAVTTAAAARSGDDSKSIAAAGPIVSALREFAAEVGRCDEFWSATDDIDANCRVLEPSVAAAPNAATPTLPRAITSRRVAIAPHTSILIEIDPHRPRQLCDCRFFGPESSTAQLKLKYNTNLSVWDAKLLPRVNLERVLGIEFPSPHDATTRDEYAIECAICHSYRDDRHASAIPDRVCDHSKCARTYHTRCLHDWLVAVPDTRVSFQTVFGKCPYCAHPITCHTIPASAATAPAPSPVIPIVP